MRNMEACHNISIALMQSIIKIGTQNTIKNEEHKKDVVGLLAAHTPSNVETEHK
jgi:hypothetical protein